MACGVVSEKLRTLDHDRPWRDDQFRFHEAVIEPGHVEVAAGRPSFTVTYRMRAHTNIKAPSPSGKPTAARVRRRISRSSRSIMLFYSSRLSFSCGGVGKPPFSRAGRAGGLTCGATMARLGPRYGSGRFSLRATSSRVEGDGLAGTGAAPMVSFPVCSPRSFFVLVRNNPSLRIASASQRIPVGPARRSPRTPSDKRHTNAYGCHESPFEPSIDSLIHRQEAKERPSVGWVRGDNGKPRRHPSPGYSPANGTGTAMTAKEKT